MGAPLGPGPGAGHARSGCARRRRATAALVAAALVLAACGGGDEAQPRGPVVEVDPSTTLPTRPPSEPRPAPELSRVEGVTTTLSVGADEGLARWREEVPGIEEVRVRSRADGHEQPVLWLPPGGEGPQPLLVALHSWSYGYQQHMGIPFGQWAASNGWAMVHPDYRGPFRTPEATGSDLAVQDVLDAVDFALEEGGVDRDRVFVIGFSGGGMMSLLVAGRHPERFAGVVSWVPIHDLADWYGYNAERGTRYAGEIRDSCGGDPLTDEGAAERCRHRSPRTHLDAARAAGVPAYIGHGVSDDVVPPAHAVRAFNQLADPSDRLPEEADAEALRGLDAETYFADGEPQALFSRRSGGTTLVLFDGGHDMVYHPGLEWMVRGTGAWDR